jgi:hypothetical protein
MQMGTLGLARKISDFESMLEQAAYSYYQDEARLMSIARSYLTLLASLTKVDEEHPEAGIAEVVSDAIDLYQQAEADLRQQQVADDARRERESAEDERRRERIRQVECPTCSASPGTGCRTSSGKPAGLHETRARSVADIA